MGHFFSRVNAYLLLTSLKVCDWSGHIFGASASPRSLIKKMAMSPSSSVHGGQHDNKYVTFELLMRAAFVADEIRGFMLEPACMHYENVFSLCSRLVFLKPLESSTLATCYDITTYFSGCPTLPPPTCPTLISDEFQTWTMYTHVHIHIYTMRSVVV